MNRRYSQHQREFYCQKSRSCPNNDDDKQVCGWDEWQPFLAVFGNICTLYRANCRGLGMFTEVDMIVCDTKAQYEKEHANETFHFKHLRPTETDPPITLALRQMTPITSTVGYITRVHRMKLVNSE